MFHGLTLTKKGLFSDHQRSVDRHPQRSSLYVLILCVTFHFALVSNHQFRCDVTMLDWRMSRVRHWLAVLTVLCVHVARTVHLISCSAALFIHPKLAMYHSHIYSPFTHVVQLSPLTLTTLLDLSDVAYKMFPDVAQNCCRLCRQPVCDLSVTIR